MGRKVAVTGDGINDVAAIRQADVGLAMGSGCDAAKEVADVILTGDDFAATLRAVLWGRNIYENVRRFLQFQVTVNISALLTVALGCVFLAESPLSAVQLLWINVIMDTLAAFALATEPPLATVLAGPPVKNPKDPDDIPMILHPVMWRQIIGMSIWNTLVMLFLILFGALFAGLDYSITDSPKDNTEGGKAKRRHLTYVFNTFVFLQLSNEVNCRKVGRRDFNVWEGMLPRNLLSREAWRQCNLYFILVVVGTFLVQVVITQYASGLTRTTPLTRTEWGACIVVGATPLLVAVLLKLAPEAWTERVRLDRLVDEGKDVSGNAVLAGYEKASQQKIGDIAAKNAAADGNFDKA